MHTPRVIRSILVLLLSAWAGGVSSAHAAHNIAGRVVVDRSLTDAPAERAGTVQFVAKTDIGEPARGSQGRILFVLASSKVHGASTLPASISFGEVVNAWDTFQAAGYSVDFVSPDGGAVPILDAYVSKDMEPRLKDEAIMNGLRNTAKPAQIDPARYRAVYYVGGSNAIYGVPEHPVLQNIAMHVYERNGGVISAVCHGTAGIVNLKLSNGQDLVAGKRITGFPEEHEEQGAAYFKEFPFLIRKTVESRGGSFHAVDDGKLPPQTWFVALYLLSSTKTNLSALELKRHLGVRYRTAWRLKHKVMQAMMAREETRQLTGFVQVDDAYLGGERNGGKPGRGSENKQPFLITVSTDENLQHPTFAVIEPVRTFDNAAILDWGRRRLASDAEVYSDGLSCFRRVIDLDHAHTVLDAGGRRAATEVRGARWVNVLLGNLKRAISGRYHAIKQAKYARRYLAEAAYRFNRRFHLREMLPRLLCAMALCAPCAEPLLRSASNFHG